MPVAIRVNGCGTAWHDDDVAAVASSHADLAVLPRAASGDECRTRRQSLGKPLLAMVETAAGVLAAAGIAREVSGLVAGTNDLAADLRLPPGAGREPMQMALQSIVLAARAAGIAAYDGVFNRLDDPAGFAAEAAASASTAKA
jgi:citrate lyase subunit beta/citryl-CoA lyase